MVVQKKRGVLSPNEIDWRLGYYRPGTEGPSLVGGVPESVHKFFVYPILSL